MYDQIKTLGKTTLLTGATLSYGSFARRTKTQPLDDIDCLALIECGGGTECYGGFYSYTVDPGTNYWLSKNVDSTGVVNSTIVLNAVKDALESVSQYSKSDIGRNGSAVVLNLKSYTWSFDVVPSCPVASGDGTTSHYVIPDGKGKWKRTDPRVDQARATEANTRHNGYFLPALRLMKFWNRRTNKPRLPSYHFETMITNGALWDTPYTSIHGAVKDMLWYISHYVEKECPDPKFHDQALDHDVPQETKQKVKAAAHSDWLRAVMALMAEDDGRDKDAISYWRDVFGPLFPSYG